MSLFSPNANRAGQRPRPFIGRAQSAAPAPEYAQPEAASLAVVAEPEEPLPAASLEELATTLAEATTEPLTAPEPASALSTHDLRHTTPDWLHAAADGEQADSSYETAPPPEPEAEEVRNVDALPQMGALDRVGYQGEPPRLGVDDSEAAEAMVEAHSSWAQPEPVLPVTAASAQEIVAETPRDVMELEAAPVEQVDEAGAIGDEVQNEQPSVQEHPTLGDLAAVPDGAVAALEVEDDLDSTPVALHDLSQWEAPEQLGPYVADVAPIDGGDYFEAMAVETAARERAVEILDMVARSVRSGEIAIPANAGTTPASMLASILASLLRSAP